MVDQQEGWPLVSVIVPNYNHARYLPLRLESILAQTVSNFELIFLDDASTDNSLDVFQHYFSDPRIRSEFNKVNSGSPFRQWNLGMSLARGKYIWLAESDDFCSPNFLETLVKELETDSQFGLAFCQSNYVDLCSNVIGIFSYGHFPNRSRWTRDFRANGTEEICQYFSIANAIPNASAVVFRADLAKTVFTVSERMKLAGDWMFWVQFLRKTNLIYVSKPLNYFRQAHEHSQRFRSSKKGLEILEGLEIYDYIVREVGLTNRQKKRALNSKIRQWMYLSWLHQPENDVKSQIYRRFEEFGMGVYSESALIVKLSIYFQVLFHAITQQPLIRKILKPIWLFFRR